MRADEYHEDESASAAADRDRIDEARDARADRAAEAWMSRSAPPLRSHTYTRPQALRDTIATLVASHGPRAVLEAIGAICQREAGLQCFATPLKATARRAQARRKETSDARP
jgi:hypothetical protein